MWHGARFVAPKCLPPPHVAWSDSIASLVMLDEAEELRLNIMRPVLSSNLRPHRFLNFKLMLKHLSYKVAGDL